MGQEQSTPAELGEANSLETESAGAGTTPTTGLPVPAIESLSPEDIVQMLRDLALTPDSDASTIEECCKRVRVLCRDKIDCDKCARSGAAAAVVDVMGSASASASVQLQGLAAIVNLCSGEGHDHRSKAVEIGVLPCIVKAMDNHTKYPEVQEMGCIALQNCCYGEDEDAIPRRKQAAAVGALRATVSMITRHEDEPAAKEVGVATLRLIVHKTPELRKQAIAEGVRPEWVKLPEAGKSGFLSLRRGFGTSRRQSRGSR